MANKPNILFIHWHDLGRYLGCYDRSWIQSSHLDQFAKEGVLFQNAFCTSPLCSPARGSLFTGKYPHSNGLMGLVNLGWNLPQNEKTMQDYLSEVGYETALFGFQHERKNVEDLGFDHVYDPGDTPLADNLPPLIDQYLSQKHEKPFFACVGFYEVHRFGAEGYPEKMYPPLDPESVEVPPFLPDNELTRLDLAGFRSSIRVADEGVGKILESLERNGLKENTLVVFTTDHGMAFPRAKSMLYDQGIEVALMMRCPKQFRGGRKIEELVSHADVLPTMMELLGVEANTDIQGKSFAGLLQEKKEFRPRKMIFSEKNYHNDYDPIRCVRTTQYKFIKSFSEGPRISIPNDIEKSLTRKGMDDLCNEARVLKEFYDLEKDPWELDNKIEDPAYRTEIIKYEEALEKWMEETGDPLLEGEILQPA